MIRLFFRKKIKMSFVFFMRTSRTEKIKVLDVLPYFLRIKFRKFSEFKNQVYYFLQKKNS